MSARRPTRPADVAAKLAPTVRAYLGALVRDADLADELSQQFLLRVLERGFRPPPGRSREYLKAALRNAVRTHLRRRRPAGADGLETVADPSAPDPAAAIEVASAEQWRAGVMAAAWERLVEHERQTPGNRAYTVLRLACDNPTSPSVELAGRVTGDDGRPMSVVAFRKQLSRARRLFARFLAEAAADALTAADRAAVEAELAALGLLRFVREALPPASEGERPA